MNRRNFVTTIGAQGLFLSGFAPVLASTKKQEQRDLGINPGKDKITHIGEWSLQDIRNIFHDEFYNNNLPIWRDHVVDQKYGGYIPYTSSYYRDGKLMMTDKRLYHQGRCLWVYSYIYNHFEKDERYLNAAKQGYEFLYKYGYDEKTSLWVQRLSRKGEVLIPFSDIFACIYMFLGLGEYYYATGDEEVAELAENTAHAIIKKLTSNDFQIPGHSPGNEQYGTYREPGTRRLGLWMHFISGLTSFLRYRKNPSLELIARFAVRSMLEKHWDKEKRFAWEFLQHDYTPYPNNYHTHETMRVADGFHSVETSWMCMDEAIRTGNYDMYMDALALGKDVMEMLWLERDGRQGLVRFYWPDDKDPMARAKIERPYVMNEAWVMLLLGMEHSGASWCVEWFEKSFTYSYKTAKLNFPYGETLHHPRGLMLGMQILDRMIARDGMPSDFLETSRAPKPLDNYR